MKRVYPFCLLAFLSPLGTGSASSQALPAAGQRAEIEQILNEQVTAWNRGDGLAWASSFSVDADFINIRGDVFRGRQQIAERHSTIFAGPYKGSHLKIDLRGLTEPTPGLALVETDQEVTGFAFMPPGIAPTEPGVLRTRMKYVAMQKDGSWQLIAAQNTAVLPAAGPK